jgi:hypothetical protein
VSPAVQPLVQGRPEGAQQGSVPSALRRTGRNLCGGLPTTVIYDSFREITGKLRHLSPEQASPKADGQPRAEPDR